MIGYILKPQGIRGEIKVDPVSPDPARFKRLEKIYIQSKTLNSYSLESVRLTNKFVFLKLVGINSREDAELLRGAEILIPEEDLLELGENEYFVHDLIGCAVVDEQDTLIGEIREIMQHMSNDIYIVDTPDERQIMIPAVRDVVRRIDLKTKKITIRILEGLLD